LIRKLLTEKRLTGPGRFRYRGHEIQRIETFSDAVFAFAITLLIVSLEVPKNFDELLTSIRGFLAFGICFAILFLIWCEQHVFFRRYGLEDNLILFLNAVLLFIVLFYVYPLKFLSSLLFGDSIYGSGKSPFSIRERQLPQLMIVYGLGFIVVYVVFLLLYTHALRCRTRLELTAIELFDTRSKIGANIIMVSIGVISLFVALILPARQGGVAGWIYIVIGPAMWVFYARRGRLRKKLRP
jgi:uncharacterized membrane protein